MTDSEKLASCSLAILKEGSFHDELVPAITAYTALLFSLSPIHSDAERHRAHIETASGQAIGTFWAAQCVKEVIRTQRFVQGLAAAIRDVRKAKPDEAVTVLYAGTGPFATLALPIMATHLPSEVQFTLLEINPESYQALLNTLDRLELNAFVSHTAIADASTWSLEGQHFDIVLSETMNAALLKEPQVSIMVNIASQLKDPEVIFIPEEINVSVSAQGRNGADKKHLDSLLTFNKRYMYDLIERKRDGLWDFEEVAVTFDADDRLYLETAITVYNGYRLTGTDCSLNIPQPVRLEKGNKDGNISFRYAVSSTPGFEHKLLACS